MAEVFSVERSKIKVKNLKKMFCFEDVQNHINDAVELFSSRPKYLCTTAPIKWKRTRGRPECCLRGMSITC